MVGRLGAVRCDGRPTDRRPQRRHEKLMKPVLVGVWQTFSEVS
jgi:hypothetical protein